MKPLYISIFFLIILGSAHSSIAQCAITDITTDNTSCGDRLVVETDRSLPNDAFIEWSNGQAGTFAQTVHNIHVNQNGAYSVTVTWPDGCTATFAKMITGIDPDGMGIEVITTPTCAGGSQGSIQINGTVGDNRMIFADWDNDAFDGMTTVTNLAAGSYIVNTRCRDDEGDQLRSNSMTLIVEESQVLSLDIEEVNDCPTSPDGDGRIMLAVTGGTGPYNFDWDDNTLDISNDPDGMVNYMGLSQGTYDVTVTDVNNCSITGSATIGEAGLVPIITGITGNTTICAGTNNNLTVEGTNIDGFGTIVVWTLPDGTMVTGTVGAGDLTLSNITQVGTYTVMLTRTNDCEVSESVDVTALDATLIVTPDCVGDAMPDGSISVTITGGVGPYDLDWDNNDLDVTGNPDGIVNYTALAAGSYMVTITDANNCMTIESANIASQVTPIIEMVNDTTFCPGLSTSLFVVGMNFQPTTNVTWTYPNGATVSELRGNGGQTLAGVNIAGVYMVEVVGANGCSDKLTFTVSESPPIIINRTEPSSPSCDGTASAFQTVSVSGGVEPYEYDWSVDGLGDFDDAATSNFFIPTDDLTIVIRDANGCIASRVFDKFLYNAPDISVNQTGINCMAGTIQLTLVDNDINTSFGNSATIEWSNGVTGNLTTGANVIEVTSPGMYMVTVTKNNTCSSTTSINLTTSLEPMIVVDEILAACDGAMNGAIDISVSGGEPPYSFDWNNDGAGDFNDPEDLSGLSPNTYMLTVRDGNGCTSTTSVTVPNSNSTIDIVSVTAGGCQGDSTQLFVLVEYTNPPATGAIEVELLGEIQTVALSGNNPFYLTFNLLSGTVVNEMVEARFTDVNCSDMALANQVGCNDNAPVCDATSVGGSMYLDYNNNGIREATEYGEQNQEVQIREVDGTTLICTIFTDDFGNFTCSGLTPGQEVLIFMPGNSVTDFAVAGPDNDLNFFTTTAGNCDISVGTVYPPEQTLPPDLDFNYEIGNRVWEDIDNSGNQNPGEPSIPGVVVELYDDMGNLIVATTTDMNGEYYFNNSNVPGGITINTNYYIIYGGMGQFDPMTGGLSIGSDVYNLAPSGTGNQSNNDAIILSGTGTPLDGLVGNPIMFAATNSHNQDAGFVNVCPTITDMVITPFACGSFIELIGTGFVDSTYIQWSNGNASYAIDTGYDIFASESGTYSVTVTNPDGCEVTYSENLTLQNNFGTEVAVQPACNGNNGSIEILATGNNITYDWENDAFDGMSTVSGLAPGIYKVVVRVPSGTFAFPNCSNTMSIIVPETPVIADIIVDPQRCGDEIRVITNGPFPTGTFFEWSNGLSSYLEQGGCDIRINQSGTYTVTVTYPNGCEGTFTKDVTVRPEGPGATVNITDTCPGASTGVIDISAEFVGGTVNYNWANDAFDGMSMVSNLAAGEYNISVSYSDGANCGFNIMSLRVEESPAITITPTVTGSTGCTVGIGSSVVLEVFDGNPPYTFDWDNDGTGDFDDTQDLTNIPPGDYVVVVRDANGCEQTAMATVDFEGVPITVNVNSTTDATCGLMDGEIDISVLNGSGNYQYDWDNDGLGDADDSAILTNIGAGNYTVVVLDLDTGCDTKTSVSISETGTSISLDLVTTSFCDANRPGAIDMTITDLSGLNTYTIDWDNNGIGDTNDPEDLMNLMPGTYNVTVTETGNGCMAIGTTTIEDNDLELGRTRTFSCDNSPNAAIDLVITGGAMPYLIDWNTDGVGDFDDPISLTGLDPNSGLLYEAIVEDAAGCRDTVAIAAGNLGAAILTTEIIPNCTTFETDLIVSGGFNQIATIEWSTGEVSTGTTTGSATITVAVPSTYMVTITKNNGCESVATFDVNPITDITLDFTKEDICDGNVSGSIDMTISGGLAPYMIDWSNDGVGDNDDNEDISNLPPGTYTVVVTDANACSETGTIEIANGPIVTDLVTTTDQCGNTLAEIVFSNIQDGAFIEWSIGVSGFYPDPQFSATPDYILRQLVNTSGTYSVTVTNPDGCSTVYSEDLIINNPTGFAFDVDVIPACGGDNGEVTINPSGGAEPYTIMWVDPSLSGFSQTGLAPGNYYVLVSDAQRCISAGIIVIPEGTNFTLSATSTDECIGTGPFGGTIDLTTTGGLGPFTFDWDNDGVGDNDDTEDLSNLSAGTYNVTVTSFDGCIAETSIDIGTQMPLPLIVGDTRICPGVEQDIYLMDVDPNTTIAWSNGISGTIADGADTITITQAGFYNVTLTNESGCSANSAIVVSPFYEVFISPINQGCNGELGRVDLSILGDTGPYMIDWDNDGVGDNDDPQNLINLSAGTYSVTVTDVMGCQQTASAVIESFDEIIVGTLGIDPLCIGVPGTASVFVGGDGRSPFTFIWSSNANVPIGVNTSIATGLDAGAYSVTVIDAVGCREEATFNLAPAIIDLAITADITPAPCVANVNDGAIDITVDGAVPPYAFQWSNGATTEDLFNIGVGLYDLTVTDANGCFREMQFEVTGFLDVSVSSVQNVCFETDMSGAIDVDIMGGSGAFTFDWDNDGVGEGDDTEDLTGLTPGLYTLVIQDQSLNCTGTVNAEILNVKPNIGIVGDTTICQGQETTLQAVGDIFDDQLITWSTGRMGLAAMDFDTINISQIGIYSVIATSSDPAMCMDTATIRVVPAVEIFLTPSNLGCNGELGEINLQITGDSGPYRVDWDTDGTGDFDDMEDITGLAPGTYNVSVANVDGCVVTGSTTITDFDLIANGIVTQQPVCNGIGGVIAVFPGGDGRPPFNFEWSDNVILDPTDNPQILTNLDSGTYTVTVTDGNGCEQIETVTLAPPTIVIDVMGTTIASSCSAGDNNGGIDITANGGAMPYAYNWSNLSTTEDLSSIGSGEYIVTVTDLDGCMGIDTFMVAGTLSIEITALTEACSNDGTVDITVVGTSGPYTFDWSNDGVGDFDDPEDLTGLAPGTYNVVVQDANNCVGTQNIEIIEGSIEVEITGNPVVCTGTPSDLTVSGVGDPIPADATITWSTGDTGTMMSGANVVSVDMPGFYSVTVTTVEGCEDVAQFFTTAPYEVFITPVSLGCNGELGQIDLTVNGDSGPYIIDWDNDGVGDNDDPEDLTNLSPGLYTVTVTDINGCTLTETVEILPFDAIIIGTVEIDPLCEGVNGTVGVFVGGDGRSPFTYIWSSNANVAFGDNVAFIEDLEPGTYTVTVIDNNGCREEKEFILEDPIITVNLDADITPSTCVSGMNNGVIDLTVNGGVGPYSYMWSNGQTTEDIGSLPLGTYDITVVDVNNCTIIDEFEVPGVLELMVDNTDDVCFDTDTSGAIDISIVGGSGTFEYDWDNDGLGDFDDTQDLAGLGAGNYRVLVRDVNTQCEGTIDTTIFNFDPDINIVGDTTICAEQITTLQVIGNIVDGEILEWNTGQIGTVDTDTDTINVGDIGIYSVIATTVGNTVCRDTATVRVVPALEIFLTEQNLGCNGELGGINMDIIGDAGPHQVDWDIDGIGDFDDDANLTGLNVGTYNVTVVNADGCPTTATAEVGGFDLFVNGVVSQDPVCDGIFGVIGVFPGGDGRPPFVLNWSDNVVIPPGNPGQIASGLEPGVYSVTVTDFNGCTQADTVTLAPYTRVIQTEGTIQEATCTGEEMDGAVDLTVTEGGGGYIYNWSTGAMTEDISMLSTGTYAVTVNDQDGCIARDTFEINPALMIENIMIQADTFICGDGVEKTLTVVGDFMDMDMIEWSTGVMGTSATGADQITITTAGSYSVTITNAQGCGTSTSIMVTDESIASLEILGEFVICENESRLLYIVGDFDEDDIIQWSAGVLGTSATGADSIMVNNPGIYDVTVTNEFGCSETTQVDLQDVGIDGITIQGDNFLCGGESKTLTVSGDIAQDATITWSTGTTGMLVDGADQITISGAGTYSVTVSNTFSCEAIASIEVTDETVEPVTITGMENICTSDTEQVLTVSGNIAQDATITWSTGATGMLVDGADQLTVMGAGTYSVTVANTFGCEAITSIDVTDGMVNAISIAGLENICTSDTEQVLTVSGDIAQDATITWSTGTTGTLADGADQLTVMGAGTYSVTVTNTFSCEAIASIDVVDGMVNAINIAGIENICTSDTEQVLTVSGSIAQDATITWSTGTTGMLVDGADEITVIGAGTYSVTVSNDLGCEAVTSIDITDETVNPVSITGMESICSSDLEQVLTVTGMIQANETITWSTGETGTLADGADEITVIGASIYSVTVSNAFGCESIASIEVTNETVSSIDITGMEIICSSDAEQVLTVTGMIQANETITWNTGETGTLTDGADEITVIGAGTYSVTISNGFACETTASITITNETVGAIMIAGMEVVCTAGESQTLTASGDIAQDATITWSTGITGTLADGADEIIINIPGTYNVTVTNTAGCSNTASIQIEEEEVDINIDATKTVICTGEVIPLTIQGDFAAMDMITWSTGESGTSLTNANEITVDVPGVYSVTVTNALGCMDMATIEIFDGRIDEINIIGDDFVCAGSTQTLTVTGDFDETATIAWSTGTTGTITDGANQIIINGAATYSVTVTNTDACSAETSIVITERLLPNITFTAMQVTCGEADGTIELNVTGTGTFTFNWSHLPGQDNVMNVSGLASGTYTVTVTDDGDCQSMETIEVTELPAAKCLPATFEIKSKPANVGGDNNRRGKKKR